MRRTFNTARGWRMTMRAACECRLTPPRDPWGSDEERLAGGARRIELTYARRSRDVARCPHGSREVRRPRPVERMAWRRSAFHRDSGFRPGRLRRNLSDDATAGALYRRTGETALHRPTGRRSETTSGPSLHHRSRTVDGYRSGRTVHVGAGALNSLRVDDSRVRRRRPVGRSRQGEHHHATRRARADAWSDAGARALSPHSLRDRRRSGRYRAEAVDHRRA